MTIAVLQWTTLLFQEQKTCEIKNRKRLHACLWINAETTTFHECHKGLKVDGNARNPDKGYQAERKLLRVSLSSNLGFRIQKNALYHECIHSNLFFYPLDHRREVFLPRMYPIIYISENEPSLAGHGVEPPLIFA